MRAGQDAVEMETNNPRERLRAGLWLLSWLQLAACAWLLWRSPAEALAMNLFDSVEYTVSALRLVAGEGLTVTIDGVAYPTRYAFGFPLLIAPTFRFFDVGPGAAISTVWVFGVGCVYLTQRLGRLAVEGAAGLGCGLLNVGVLMTLASFPRLTREIMSDVPLLFLVLLALNAFVAASRRRRSGSFLLGGAAIAVAMSMRITSVAYCLPFAILAMRGSGGRLKALLASALFPLLSLLAICLYNTRVFGAPLYTGYHYWLTPASYALSPEHLWSNLLAFLGPLDVWVPARPRQLFLGAAGMLTSLLLIVLLRRRPAAWRRVQPNAAFLLAGALPISVMHLFYPFPSPRFHLGLYVILFSLGCSALFLLSRRSLSRLSWSVLLVASFALIYDGRDRRPADSYWIDFMRQADDVLPADAVLISSLHGVQLDSWLGRGGAREFVPLSGRSPFAHWKVGRHGEERVSVYPFVAGDAPDEVESLLRGGRRVFVEFPRQASAGPTQALEALGQRFELAPVMRMRGRDVMAELSLRE